MVLVVPDEAAGLLGSVSAEGDLARWFVRHAVQYGRKAGLDVRVSVAAAASCPADLRGILSGSGAVTPGGTAR
jgi:hypothetical protein